MIKEQPALIRQEGDRAGADLRTLPCTLRKWRHLHDTTMFAPVLHVRTEADVDVAERRMAIVARTAQHGIFSVDFLGEEHAVAVEWQKGILALIELLEIEGVGNADSRTVIAVAPSDPVAVINPCDTRVILIL